MMLDGSAKSDLERTAQQWKGWSVEGVVRKAIAYIEQLEVALKCEQVARTVLLEDMPKWISVEERLPERYTPVFGFVEPYMDQPYLSTKMYVVVWDGNYWFKDNGGYYDDPEGLVTRWMPLPELPEEE